MLVGRFICKLPSKVRRGIGARMWRTFSPFLKSLPPRGEMCSLTLKKSAVDSSSKPVRNGLYVKLNNASENMICLLLQTATCI